MENSFDLSQLDYRALTPLQQATVRDWAVERARQLRAETVQRALRWLFGGEQASPPPACGRAAPLRQPPS